MHHIPPKICTPSMYATVHYTSTFDTHDGQCVQLLYEDGAIGAWSWLPVCEMQPNLVLKANVGLLPVDTPQGSSYVLTYVEPADEIEVFSLIPNFFGHQDDILLRFRDVVDACQNPALRNFLSDAFSIYTVYRYFWTFPASRAHHHAYRGGLASHCIEMAEQVRDATHLNQSQRDIGIVYALTHDVGKLWCFDRSLPNLEAIGHELVGVAQLEWPLHELWKVWPDGDTAMRSLLSGKWKVENNRPIMAVGAFVRSLDQLSAERDLMFREGHRYQPWVPSPPARVSLLPNPRYAHGVLDHEDPRNRRT